MELPTHFGGRCGNSSLEVAWNRGMRGPRKLVFGFPVP